MEVLGRDDELRSVRAFFEGPAIEGMATRSCSKARRGSASRRSGGRVRGCSRSGFRVLSSRPGELDRGVAYAALGDLLEEAFAEVRSELPAPRRRALEVALLVRDPEDEPVDFRTVAVAVRTALEALAERGPVLIAIDDVQWLDPSSANALAFALRRSARGADPPAARPSHRGRFSCVQPRAGGRRPSRAPLRRSAQRRCAAPDAPAPARAGLRPAHAPPSPRDLRREPVLRARARPRARTGRRFRRSRWRCRRASKVSLAHACATCRRIRATPCCSPASMASCRPAGLTRPRWNRRSRTG